MYQPAWIELVALKSVHRVPRYRLNSFVRRRLAVADPSISNSLPNSLRDPELSLDTFKRQLKTYFCQIFMTKFIKRTRDFFEYDLYKFIL